jgi:hypothetical protein
MTELQLSLLVAAEMLATLARGTLEAQGFTESEVEETCRLDAARFHVYLDDGLAYDMTGNKTEVMS